MMKSVRSLAHCEARGCVEGLGEALLSAIDGFVLPAVSTRCSRRQNKNPTHVALEAHLAAHTAIPILVCRNPAMLFEGWRELLLRRFGVSGGGDRPVWELLRTGPGCIVQVRRH